MAQRKVLQEIRAVREHRLPMRARLQTREHVIKECRSYIQHRLTLGHGRYARIMVKEIRKLITSIKRSNAFDKDDRNRPSERARDRREN